ncbi:MAG: peptidase S9 family protein [Anaerolineaceae bacterium]|nr:peptidase S9 family protein [Anaerolineaceae bacterium]
MAKPTHIPTIQELIELPTLETAQISPNGRFIAYEQSQPDWEEDSYVSQIWLVATQGKPEPRRLTFTPNGSRHPRWSPDGRFLAFISKREEDKASQIYRLALVGGEAERLSEAKTDVQQFLWAPDGQSLAFTAVDPESETDKEREKTFGKYQVEDEDFKYTHLWQLTLPDKKQRRLTGGKQFTVSSFRWSPDGQKIAFAAPPNPDMGNFEQTQLYQLDVATLRLEALTPAGYMTPLYSPDGRFLFCLQIAEFYYEPEKPCLIDLDSGKLQHIPFDFGENIQPLIWLEAGVIFSAVKRTSIHFYRLQPESGEITQITPDLEDGWVSFAFTGSVAEDGRFAALIMDNASQLNEVVLLDLENGDWRNLTNLSADAADWQLSQPEPYRWQSTDGTPIEGTLTKPVDFDPQKKYPLLVAIHGGPSWVSLQQKLARYDRRSYPLPLWAAKGALILQPNYRGSLGYGAQFQAHNVRNLGLGDYDDVISGVDTLIAEGWVDEEKVGAMGWSQGGYISMFISTYSDRFKAVSAGAGISNWMTYYVNTDVHPFTRHYLQATPWDEMEIYAQTSPMTYIKKAQTPTLIQHGREDTRVPLPNAYELYQGLHDMDVPVRLVTYPGMPHGPRKPRQSRQIMQDNLDWFNKWIWDEETDVEKRPCYVGYGTKQQMAELVHWASHDTADCRLFSATHGLVAPDTDLEDQSGISTTAAALASTIAQQLKALNCSKLVLYSAAVEKRPSAQTVLGCLHLAAAQIGGLKVVHEEVEEWGRE